MRRFLAALALVLGSFGITTSPQVAHADEIGCSAWTTGNWGYAACTIRDTTDDYFKWRVQATCRTNAPYVSYKTVSSAWRTTSGVQGVYCGASWTAVSARFSYIWCCYPT